MILLISFSVLGGFCSGETETEKEIRGLGREEERLVVFEVDVLDYHSILIALKGCSAMFCCLDSRDGYDVCWLSVY